MVCVVCVCVCMCRTCTHNYNYTYQMILIDTGDILIASCGQDMFVRVWRLSQELVKDSSATDDELKVKKNFFTVSSQSECYNVTLNKETEELINVIYCELLHVAFYTKLKCFSLLILNLEAS